MNENENGLFDRLRLRVQSDPSFRIVLETMLTVVKPPKPPVPLRMLTEHATPELDTASGVLTLSWADTQEYRATTVDFVEVGRVLDAVLKVFDVGNRQAISALLAEALDAKSFNEYPRTGE